MKTLKIIVLVFSIFSIPSHALESSCQWQDIQLPGKKPGELISLEYLDHLPKEKLVEIVPDYIGSPKNGVFRYRMTYKSQDPNGKLLDVSGLVIVPDTCKKDYPIINWQHGTVVENSYAPSVRKNLGRVEGSQGFLVLSQDYIGYGASKGHVHPFGIASSYGRTGVDMILAFRQAVTGKLKLKQKMFIQGYSEGGYGAFALQKMIEQNYSKDIPIAGIAIGAGFFDIPLTGAAIISQEKTNPIYPSFMLSSFIHYFGEKDDYKKVFAVADKIDFDQLFRGGESYKGLKEKLPHEMSELFNWSFRYPFIAKTFLSYKLQSRPSWVPYTDLENISYKNSLLRADWTPKFDTHFFHCTDDRVVPVMTSDQAFEKFKHLNHVQYTRIESKDFPYNHGNCPAIHQPLVWFNSIIESTKIGEVSSSEEKTL